MAFAPPSAGSPSELPGSDPLTIGSITFTSLECPEKPPIGGVEDKAPAVELVGGGRAVYSVGAQPQDIEWSGRFLQPNAWQKVAALRALAVAGTEVLLSWLTEQWYGKVVKLIPKPRYANYVDYELTFRITRDGNGALTATAPTSVDSQVSALTASANSQNTAIASLDPTGSQSFQQPLATMVAVLGSAGPIAQLTGANLANVQSAIAAALLAVQTYAGATSDAQPQYVATQQLLASLSLIATFVDEGQGQNVLTVQGATLFDVAAQVYGDASLAFDLAQANGLPSPFTSTASPTTLVLPPYPVAA
jgi:hypothetical protein